MTTLIYKFAPKYMGKSKYTLRLCGFCPEDSAEFTVRLPADGKVMLGEVEKPTRGGACQFSSRELHDGVFTPKALIGGKLYTAEPIIIDGTLTVTQRDVVLDAPDQTKEYDGTYLMGALGPQDVVGGLGANDVIYVTMTGEQVNVGTSVTQVVEYWIIHAGTTNVTHCYNVK